MSYLLSSNEDSDGDHPFFISDEEWEESSKTSEDRIQEAKENLVDDDVIDEYRNAIAKGDEGEIAQAESALIEATEEMKDELELDTSEFSDPEGNEDGPWGRAFE